MTAALIPWLLRGLPWLLAVAAVIGAGTYLHHAGEVDATERVSAKYDAKITAMQSAAAAQHLADVNAARDAEQSHATAIAAIAADNLQKADHEKVLADKTIADIRAGTLRLRDRFTAPACAGGLPGIAAGPGVDHGTVAGGLQSQDAVFLVSESARADDSHAQQACSA